MPKAAPDADDDDAPKAARVKRKRGAVKAKAATRRARRATRRSNPEGDAKGWGILEDLQLVGVGLGAYGGTRLLQRLATRVVAKKKPAWTRHAHALSGALAFIGAIYGVRKVKQVAGWEASIVLGTGVAAAQGVVSAYVPKYAWLMNDAAAALPAPAAATNAALPAASAGMDYLEHELQQMEAAAPRSHRPVAQALKTAAAAAGDQGLEDSLVEELGDEDVDSLYGGIFTDPTLLAS